MDTKTLKDGQVVYMVSECYMNRGKVIAVTPSNVIVQPDEIVEITSSGAVVQPASKLMRFDNEGNELEESRRDRLGFGPSPDDKFHTALWFSAPEFQPWHLADIPAEKREV